MGYVVDNRRIAFGLDAEKQGVAYTLGMSVLAQGRQVMKMNGINGQGVIAGLATPPGIGGIAVIRVSGAGVFPVLDPVFRGNRKPSQMASHTVAHGYIQDENRQTVDEVLLLVMHGPRSYTGEDVAEIHCHGGMASVRAITALLYRLGIRGAEPGEFTKRAFLNGRLDLSQAESLMDLIGAKTELGRQAALGQLQGSLSRWIGECRERILYMTAKIEAAIDFPEEGLETVDTDWIALECREIAREMEKIRQSMDRGKLLRDGITTVILGKPNVGKSSLLNAFLDEDRAIVTDTPGTTRDTVSEFIQVKGIPIRLVDTAGIRETENQIEKIGVEKSRSLGQQADLVFLVLDGSNPLTEEDKEILVSLKSQKVIVLVNKGDLPQEADMGMVEEILGPQAIFGISAKEKAGLDQVYDYLIRLFFQGEVDLSSESFLANERQKDAVNRAMASLNHVVDTVAMGLPEELLTVDLMDAYRFLGEITGETVGDDVIDKIFSTFCVGK